MATPALAGTYFYGDLCLQFVKTFNKQSGEFTDLPDLHPAGQSITSFGEDAQGELYVVTNQGGSIGSLPRLSACCSTVF
jgi:hypothetical protein